ncbi:PfkB family carbohydrate kinase [Rhizobium sp. S152]|uniref:PfkB family carbohydrate kinase n=1 Tax=Rhizobium sp. S152 TaxID=3055038 RepID=UPI0025A98340|nr:PfkB family carbohydrate kinase [Rhizobium sp. S152]MDM9628460.1 PfkB family carbohydrate kinase [Rhizobium sp. S152]
MTAVDIVGGVYREKCAFPYWDELFGSAGRAAMALAASGLTLRLHTALSSREKISAAAIFEQYGVSIFVTDRPEPIVFDYVHSLAVPAITPQLPLAPVKVPPIRNKIVIKFGMLESDPEVVSDYCVYDPQSAFEVLPFSASRSQAAHLAIVANKGEALRMTETADLAAAAKTLQDRDGAEVVIIKDGLNGAAVYHEGKVSAVPAYKTTNVFTIGSGDVFVAAFTKAWAVDRMDPAEAANIASLATAAYVESRILPLSNEAISTNREPARRTGGNVYLAGPFRETGQRMLIDDVRNHLRDLGMSVFSPIHDVGPGSADIVVQHDISAIRDCDVVFALLNGSSPGTVFEVGFARALEKPVFCVAQNMREVDLKLPRGTGAYLHDDLVSAMFQIAWR